jgi:hypothetical protein
VSVWVSCASNRAGLTCSAAVTGKPPQANRICRQKPCTNLHLIGNSPSFSSRFGFDFFSAPSSEGFLPCNRPLFSCGSVALEDEIEDLPTSGSEMNLAVAGDSSTSCGTVASGALHHILLTASPGRSWMRPWRPARLPRRPALFCCLVVRLPMETSFCLNRQRSNTFV